MKQNETGFSYVDTMVGLTIMLIGLLGLAGTIGASVMRSRQQEKQLLAKQYATSSLETILSARDTDLTSLQDGWDSIGNIGSNLVGGTPRGVFVTGEKLMKFSKGPDGVKNTPDDDLTAPGPDQLIGTLDDNGTESLGMTREIIITDICDPDRPSPNCSSPGVNPVTARQITVKVRYSAGSTNSNSANNNYTETVSTTLTKY